VPSFNEIFEQLQVLTLAVYTPLAYVFPSRREKYEDLYNVKGGTARDNLGQFGREQGLKKLMTVNLLKRLESSVEAFRITLDKIEGAVNHTLTRLEMHIRRPRPRSTSTCWAWTSTSTTRTTPTSRRSPSARRSRSTSRTSTSSPGSVTSGTTARPCASCSTRCARSPPSTTSSSRNSSAWHSPRLAQPINPGNKKSLIFSAFADTANYLYRELAPDFERKGLASAIVTGGSHGAKTTLGTGYDFQQVLTLFSPKSKQRHLTMPKETAELDILIGTDVISEGQNLQDGDFLVNYDIHWNPVRIIQRFGRIDRIGSTNAQIQMVNFWPDISLDEYINLKERVENRMVIADLAGTADDNVLTLEGSEAAFRKEQLRKLQDEVIELEDVRTGVSITDLGLNDFRMDLLGYMKENDDIATAPKGLHAVVPADPAKGLVPGVIFALRNVNADEHINRGNRLHPHYLVYLDDQGKVVADHTEAKHLLDLLRAGCRPTTSQSATSSRTFNAAPSEGAEMGKYSALLTDRDPHHDRRHRRTATSTASSPMGPPRP
jgi:hypothetical protein